MTPYSIVVVAHNHQRELLRTLLAVRQCAAPDEVVVVDNGSSADLGAVLTLSRLACARVLRQVEHQSLAAALNVGLDVVRNELVLLLDRDVILTRDPGLAVDWMAAHTAVGVAGGTLYQIGPEPRRVLHAGYIVGRGRVGTEHRGWNRWKRYPVAESIQAVSSACMLVRRTELRFDERYWFCLQDVDFCFQNRQQGLDVMYLPELEAVDPEDGGLNEDGVDAEWAARCIDTHLLHHQRWCSALDLHELPAQRAVRGADARAYLAQITAGGAEPDN